MASGLLEQIAPQVLPGALTHGTSKLDDGNPLDRGDLSRVEVFAMDHVRPEAAWERFAGSPTIRIDGMDVQPSGEEPFGLTCRVYHRRDGRISPTPDPADVRDALLAAQTATATTRSFG
jgi:hypothetical protein